MADPQGADFDYYREIYLRGLGGERPSLPIDWGELERRAEQEMEPRAADYVFAGAGQRRDDAGEPGRVRAPADRPADAPRRLRPRPLGQHRRNRDAGAAAAGADRRPLDSPPDGELATAARGRERRAAADRELGLRRTRSRRSPRPAATAPRWFQLYWPNDSELAASFVSRAEAAGYSAIVLTVDTFIPGWKPRDLQRAWLPFLEGIGNANYLQDPVFRAALAKPPEEDLGAAIGHYLSIYVNPSLTWDDLPWLQAQTSLPILIKGILHPDDAREARERGVDGVIVSNHGGRQIDGSIASLDALPAIADAVGDELAVLLDSGVRGGADAIKAIALGADAVCIGRPYLWGLALEGREGVEKVLKMTLAELDLTLALAGYRSPGELDRTALAETHPG